MPRACIHLFVTFIPYNSSCSPFRFPSKMHSVFAILILDPACAQNSCIVSIVFLSDRVSFRATLNHLHVEYF